MSWSFIWSFVQRSGPPAGGGLGGDGPVAGQGRIQDFVLGGAYRDGNGGVLLQTCQGVWESAVSTIIPAPKP